MKRRKAREVIIQSLYQVDLAHCSWEDALTNTLEEQTPDPFMQETLAGIIEHLEQIDTQIKPKLKKWSFDRLSKIDRSILRLAVYELLFKESEELPAKIIINEAIELAKTFGNDESPRFINGVLSSVAAELQN